MITCPHCDSPLDEEASKCSVCGKPYWKTGQAALPEEIKAGEDEQMQGCLPILFWPLVLSLLVTVSLISFGFIVQILSRLTDFRLKTLWIFCSLAAGGAVYLILSRFRRRKM